MFDLPSKFSATSMKMIRKFMSPNSRLRRFLYDIRNENEFGNLYEHEKMLSDSVRIDTYKKAIEKHVTSEDIVLDLGTGTGILSFFASKKKPKLIYAIDHSKFIDIAKLIAKHNNINNVEFIKCNSRKLKSSYKVDIIMHEQIGDYLFNENMIHNLLDLKKRLLNPGGQILPGKFELFLEPASLSAESKIPFIWEKNLYGIDFEFLRRQNRALREYQPADYSQRWLETNAVEYFLCEPLPVMAFDINSLKSEAEIPRLIDISKQVVTPGALDGFCLYFKVIFDEETFFDTSPFSRQTHWGNCFFRTESRVCSEGETIRAKLAMHDLLNIHSWSVDSA